MNKESKLSVDLAAACDRLTKNYQDTLNLSDLDDKTLRVLYDLGADIKYTFDAFAAAIREYVKE